MIDKPVTDNALISIVKLLIKANDDRDQEMFGIIEGSLKDILDDRARRRMYPNPNDKR